MDFGGSVNAGLVDLNATGGLLIDSSGMLSDVINAELGGVFTGNSAEVFVGGFDLTDALNSINTVDGIYTIER